MKYEFGEFCLCSKTEKFSNKTGDLIKIEHQQFALLLLFLEQPNKIINREQIVARVWANRETSDEAIRVALKKLRDILDDNPKSPLFIKTIPKQGYKWIADVSVVNNQKTLWLTRKLAYFILTVILICLLFSWLINSQSTKKAIKSSIDIQQLTDLPGSEVVADYHHTFKKLAFLHRASSGEPQQLYVKYLTTGETIRLSWDDQNYSNVNWSPDGYKLAFTHYAAEGKILYVAYFGQNQSLERLVKFSNDELSNKSVSDWSHDGQSLLLVSEFTHGRNHSVYQFDLATQRLSAISFPNTSGRGDYAAKQSEDGNYTAILRESEPGKINLVVVDTNKGGAVVQHSLDFTPNYMVWSEDSSELSLSSFFGEHLRFNLSNQIVSYSPMLPDNSLDLFSHCGKRCYILRQHNGNFLDIQEKPLATIFTDQNTSSLISAGRLFNKAGAQDFPLYLPTDSKAVLYASLNDSVLNINQVLKGNTTTLATIKDAYQLTSLSISPNGKMLLGSIQNRLFTVNLNANNVNDVNFVTDALEQANNPIWTADSSGIMFNSYINKVPTIISLNLYTNQRSEVRQNAIAFAPISQTQALLIAPNLDLFMYKFTQGKWQQLYKIARLQSANINRWKVVGEHVYFTKYENYEAQLCRLVYRTKEAKVTCKNIGKNRFRLHFDIDSAEQRILLVESLSAESNIIQMRW